MAHRMLNKHAGYDGTPKPMGSYPDSGINLLVVGAGLAGLTAAIECTRKGHRVRVLERHNEVRTMGDMYFMGLSGTTFFKHWPDMAKEYDEISLHDCWMETFKHDGTLMIPVLKAAERLKEAGLDPNTPPGTFQMRPLVCECAESMAYYDKMFINQVERLGIEFLFGKRVVKYWETDSSAGVETDQGERFEADVVIASDGIGSKSQEIVGGEVRAASSGRAMWRVRLTQNETSEFTVVTRHKSTPRLTPSQHAQAAFPVEHLEQDPEVKSFFSMKGADPIVRTFLGPGSYGLTLTRHDVMVWIINHDTTGDERESWDHTVTSQDVLDKMDGTLTGWPSVPSWAPVLKRLVALTPPRTIVNFELFWRDPQPRWCSPGGRVVQIGDCAHSFLPSSGNGATQAIEDAVSLASCLHLAACGPARDVPTAVRAHVRFRFLRNACAQKLGFANAERLQDTDWTRARLDPRKAQPKHPRWVWDHDPERHVYENYYKCVEGLRTGVPVDEDDSIPPNYPPGYKWDPWNIEDIMKDLAQGKSVHMGAGNWN